MADMLSFCLGLLSGFSALVTSGPLFYVFGFMLFGYIVRLFLQIVFFGRSCKFDGKE